jgi:hypothetical protein
MPAKTTCPHCQLTLKVPSDYAGQSVKCPQCSERFIVEFPSVGEPSHLGSGPPTPDFESLVMSVLDEDEAETTDEVASHTHIERLSGPSHFWRCPDCQAVWEKQKLPDAHFENPRIKALARCESCGHAFDYAEVESGKLDALEVQLACPHCHLELSGPADDLLGKTCPACAHALPAR